MEYVIVCVELFVLGGLLGYIACHILVYEPQRKTTREFEAMLIRSMRQTDEALAVNNSLIKMLDDVEKQLPVKSPIQIKRV